MSRETRRITTYHKIIPGLLLLMLVAGLVLIAPRDVLAHPMGNFSISHFAGLRIEAGELDLRYILDLAEIPTFQELKQQESYRRPMTSGFSIPGVKG